MIIKCPSCGSALMYDVLSGKLHCDHCDRHFDPQDDSTERSGSMICNIYRCTACGAQLAIGSRESSTFCAYCGQPTVVFDRVSKELRPKYILPFSVDKNTAERLIRQKLRRSLFIPKSIRNFEIERLRGIYIPYFFYDISCEDKQTLGVYHRCSPNNLNSESNPYYFDYFYRHCKADFQKITADASVRLDDEASQRLDPYDLSALVPFEPEYLSGFYADRYDADPESLREIAVNRATELFDDEIRRTVKNKKAKKMYTHPNITVQTEEYALLPAWFLTFRYENTPYTVLVNGQTGKIICALPYKTSRVYGLTALLALPLSILSSLLCVRLMISPDTFLFDFYWVMFFFFAAGSALLRAGILKFQWLRQLIKLTGSHKTHRYVKDRQKEQ